MSRPGKTSSRCFENSVSIDIRSSKWPCLPQSFTIQILPSRSTIWALISPTFSFISTSTGSFPSRICCRISGTHLGHSESVERGQPRGGFDFSHDLSRGLSDHFGVGDSFREIRLRRSKTAHTPVAATVTAFSTYLIGLCILLSLSSAGELELWSQNQKVETNEPGTVPRSRKREPVQKDLSTRNLEVSMRGVGHGDAIEFVTFRHAEGNEGEKIGVK